MTDVPGRPQNVPLSGPRDVPQVGPETSPGRPHLELLRICFSSKKTVTDV